MLVGGLWTLVTLVKPIANSLSASLASIKETRLGQNISLRTERDIPITYVFWGLILLLIPIFLLILCTIMPKELDISGNFRAVLAGFSTIYILIGVFIAAAEILGLTQVSAFLYGSVFPYFGNVIVAIAILLIGIIAANFLSNLIHATLSAGEMHSAHALAAVARWSVIIMAVLTAMAQLRVATQFIENLFTAIVAMLAIAGGIAFGLGGKDHARKVLDAVERDLNK